MYLRSNQAGLLLNAWTLVLAMLALLSVGTHAVADAPRVYGVSQGEALSQPAAIWAEARGPVHWMTLELEGPGVSLSAKGGGRRVHLRESGSTGTPLAWDARRAQPGDYTLTATSYFRGRAWDVTQVGFRVVDPDATQDAVVEVEATALTPTTAVRNAPPLPDAAAVAPLPVNVDGDGAATLPSASFGALPAQLVRGVRKDLPMSLNGPLPAGADVLVLAWDVDRKQMVEAFAHTIKRAPWTVSGESVAELPAGKVELQLHVRHGRQFVQTDRKVVQVVESVAAPGDAGLPAVRFVNGSPVNVTPGDGKFLAMAASGPLPEDADVLVIAWSLGQGSLVEKFAFTIDGAPFVVPASQLAKLPAGQNEVQALVRVNGQVKSKTRHMITVKARQPVLPGGETGGTGGDPPATPDQPEPDQPEPDQPEPDQPSTGGDVPDIKDPTPTGTERPTEPPTPDVTPEPEPELVPTVGFAAGTPGSYTRGSNTAIKLTADMALPADGDVLMLAWHHDERRMIQAFAHTLEGSSMTVRNGLLDKLPGGSVELQAHLRLPQGVVQIAKRDVNVNVPVVEPEPEPVDPTPIPAGAGFTAYKPSGDSRVIYVSASGNDGNSGLSPNAPIKSPRRGYDLLRDGRPDHLLFKAGDTFRGGLGSFEKSGASGSNPMVVGVYGSGTRPKFKTDGNNFVQAFGSVSHVAFVGIHGYANRRDPGSSDYRSNDVPWQERGVAWYAKGQNITFEDCHFEWYKDNLIFQAPKEGDLRNLRLYRLISNNAWVTKSEGHAQGLFVKNVHDAEIVESTFDHNGWRPNNTGDKTKFNHNLYVQKDTKRINIRRCIVTRGSHNGIQLRGGGIIEDSLIAYNPYGAFVAEERSAVRRNVVLNGVDMNGSYPLGIGIKVLPCVQADVEDNIIANKQATAGWTGGIEVGWRDDIIDPPGSFNVAIRRNIIVNWKLNYDKSSIVMATNAANITADSNNLLDRASGGDHDPPFVDPGRDLDGYARQVGTGNHDGLLRKATQRGRGAWDDRYAAKGANAWVKAGFEFLPYD